MRKLAPILCCENIPSYISSHNFEESKKPFVRWHTTSITMIPLPILLTQLLQQLVPILVELFKAIDNMEDYDEAYECVALAQTVLETVEVMMAPAISAGNEQVARKVSMYDRNRARNAILQDYMRPNALFNDRQFKRMFRVSKEMYSVIKASAMHHPFFACREYEANGRQAICVDAKLLIALKHLAYGTSFNAFRDYFQMGETTAHLSFK
jgi:hypothetical protein